MTPSPTGRRSGRRRSDEVLRRVLPEPTHDEVPPPSAPPTGVDARRQALLDAMGEHDRESW